MKRSRIFLFATLPLASIAVILMIVACFSAYDPAVSNYFARGNPLPVPAFLFAGFAVVAGIVGTLLSKREQNPFKMQPLPLYAPLPSALGSLVSAILLFIAKQPFAGVLFLLTAAFFALTACPFAKKYAFSILWGGFASIAATVALNATYYFDMTVEMNAPIKVLLQIGLLAAMLDCTVELRLLIGKTAEILSPILTVFATVLCGLASLPMLVAQIGGKLPSLIYFASVPFLFGVFLTALIRLSRLIFTKSSDQTAVSEPKTEEKGI